MKNFRNDGSFLFDYRKYNEDTEKIILYIQIIKTSIMKNTIINFALFFTAFVAANLLMSYARPITADEPKQYILVKFGGASTEKFEQMVNEKLAEGWHLQGGLSYNGVYSQAMVK